MKLSVNIDHIATLRQARKEGFPDPIYAAVLVLLAGADGITVHLREDRRHIQDRDLELLRKIVQKKLNLEMAATDEMMDIACKIHPDSVCFVPERREELTTEGGLDVVKNLDDLIPKIKKLKEEKIIVSIFVDPDAKQIEASKKADTDFIEIHAGKFAQAFRLKDQRRLNYELKILKEATKYAQSIGLGVNLGHGLSWENLHLIKDIPNIFEVSIGFSIIADAVLLGLPEAVKRVLKVLE